MSSNDRKATYKLPPTTIRDKLISQETRRNKALEEQKRKRAQKFDSARQLDLFAGLTLGASDDEEDVGGVIQEGMEDDEEVKPTPASVAQYAAMLRPGYEGHDNPRNLPSTSTGDIFLEGGSNTASICLPPLTTSDSLVGHQEPNKSPTTKKKRSGGGSSSKQKRRANKASKWADRCMYAELLEMSADDPWESGDADGTQAYSDGLPNDLESAWVAVAPVPAGKRCLAVTQQSAGVAGVVPNTTLRSRLLGKTLMARFPSALPPLTVLDCILDNRWRENGILHVLDVVRWKGQDVADCEAGFRFWWRDTRLAELAQTPPPSSINFIAPQQATVSTPPEPTPSQYHFPYPTSFIPVPYYTNTTLPILDNEIIPLAKTWRQINVSIPISTLTSTDGLTDKEMDLEVESSSLHLPPPKPRPRIQLQPQIALISTLAHVQPDGMLLYVAEASYEPGTSPLSSWIPIQGYDSNKGDADGDANQHYIEVNGTSNSKLASEGPLDLFQRLIKKRMTNRLSENSTLTHDEHGFGTDLTINAVASTDSSGDYVDVEMDV